MYNILKELNSLLPFFGECSEHGREGGLQKNLYTYIHKYWK